MNNKGFAPIVVVLIVLAGIVLGGAGYYYTQNVKHSVSNNVSNNPDTTADWKTYHNEEYGFEIKYPNNWVVNPQPGIKTALHVPFSADFTKVGELVALNIYTNQKDFEDSYGYAWNKNLSSFQVNGITVQETPLKSDNGSSILFFFSKGGITYVLVGSEWYEPMSKNMKETTRQILSTFKFIPVAINVSGMSKYTDTDFGFSFWYPSMWVVQPVAITKPDLYVGGKVIKKWTVSAHGDSEKIIYIQAFTSPSSSITDNAESGCPGGHCSPTLRYYFDASLHTWMVEYPLGFRSDGVKDVSPGTKGPADVSDNTMGGLHMLAGGFRESDFIIPLSAHNFLIVSDAPWNVGPDFKTFLAKTVVALDPSVATPTTINKQLQTIRAEKEAYLEK